MLNRTGAVLAGAILLVCWSASAARAVTLQTTDASRPWQQWADQAQVPTWAGTLPLTVASDYIACGPWTAEGCTSATPAVDQTNGQIMPQGSPLASVSTAVYNGPAAWDARSTLYHELGQVFWSEYLTADDEAAFMRIVGLVPDVSQWGNWLYGHITVRGHAYTFPPFEWFAEGYRYCAEYGINQPLGVVDEEALFYPGDQAGFAAQQRQVCELIDSIGLREGIATPAQKSYMPTHLSGRVIAVKVKTNEQQLRRSRLIVRHIVLR